MANPSRGMPALPAALIRPAGPPDPPDPPADTVGGDAADPADAQGRGGAESSSAARPRRRKASAAAVRTSKRGLNLSDAVWERLQLEAIRKRTNVSAIAGDVLERNLPRLRIERDA